MNLVSHKIETFKGDYFYLSNYYKADVVFEGITYPTNEHAFQAAKTLDISIRKSFLTECLTPDQAKSKGHKIKLREDWEKVKVEVMIKLIRNKFMSNLDLQQKLLQTEDAILINRNTYHDAFWGIDQTSGKGLNRLGLILMAIRTELQTFTGKPVERIEVFEAGYYFLSNYYEAPVQMEGITYPSNEHAFQAAKTLDINLRKSFLKECPTPDHAKRKGRSIALRPDWKTVRLEYMSKIVRNKFMLNPDLKRKLLETGEAVLAEGNTWHDVFWGIDIFSRQGCNQLGQILMKIRTELKNFKETTESWINGFSGDYCFLSNSFEVPVRYEDLTYPTNEHAFQAAKTLDESSRISFLRECQTVKQAKEKGDSLLPRYDWEDKKKEIMSGIVRSKFISNEILREKLLATGNAILINGNTEHDRLWGVDQVTGQGLNFLGLYLMATRTEIRAMLGIPIEKIDVFEGGYFFLSNYYEAPVEFEGVVYPSNEHAYQAAKSLDLNVRKSFLKECPTPDHAKKKGRTILLRPNWDMVKVNVMYGIVRNKFMNNPLLKQKLLETGDAILKEGNTWNDTYWGVNIITGQGLNQLGNVLMKIRSELRMI